MLVVSMIPHIESAQCEHIFAIYCHIPKPKLDWIGEVSSKKKKIRWKWICIIIYKWETQDFTSVLEG